MMVSITETVVIATEDITLMKHCIEDYFETYFNLASIIIFMINWSSRNSLELN